MFVNRNDLKVFQHRLDPLLGISEYRAKSILSANHRRLVSLLQIR